MTSSVEIVAELRDVKGTGAARSVRSKGMVPGIVYGGNEEPCAISINHKELLQEIEKGAFFSRMFTLPLGKKKQNVVAKDIQFDRVTDVPIHVDFMRVNKDSTVHVHVPVHFENEAKSPGLKRGGVMNIISHQIEVVCPADSIPQSFTVDLSGIEINQSIHIDAISLPSGASFANKERDYTIVTIAAPRGMTEAEASGDADSAEGSEAESSDKS